MTTLPLAAARVDALRELSEKATAGPWRRGIGNEFRMIFRRDGGLIAERCGANDGSFITEACNFVRDVLPAIVCRIAELEAENVKLRRADSEYELLCESHQAVEAERDRLREALRPFAKEAEKYEPDEGDDKSTAWDTSLTIGHVRRARSVLAPEQGTIRADFTGDHLNPSEFSQKEM